jgi:hypothetical protein
MKLSLSILRFLMLITLLVTLSTSVLTAFAEDVQPVSNADQTFTQAVTQANKKTAASLLDSQFEFTDTQGKTFTKTQALDQLSIITTASSGATEVRSYNYGQVGDVFGIHQNTRFLRVWVKRADGWKLFNYIETPIGERVPLPSKRGDCDNPCRTIPFTPTTAMDKAIIEAWQKAKNDEWHPNSSDWALRVADEFLIINTGTARSKPERVALLAKQQAAGESGPPGDPINHIRMFDFGDKAVVMLSLHNPYAGGKPYYNVRVWIFRDNLWQLAVSQQTTIQAAEAVPPVHE